jgi:hypothetical protein
MPRGIPDLSDWIKFLLSTRTLSYSLVGILLSLMVAFFGYSTFYSDKISETLRVTLIISAFVLMGANYLFIFHKKSPLNKSNRILREIMKKKIIGILVCTLLIRTTLPVIGFN